MRLSAWQQIAPASLSRSEPLAGIDAYLAEHSSVGILHDLEQSESTLGAVVAELRARSLAELFVPERATSPELSALNAITARRSGSLAITVGVNGLALLPVYLAGDSGQCQRVTDRLRSGAAAAMLLTEWDHGSNLLRNQATARANADGYLLDGAKHLINGGTEHELLVVFLRTGRSAVPDSPGGLRDFTLFIVERDATIEALPRWRTLATRSADISGVRFRGTRVPPDAVLGGVGEGFGIVQKTLMMSRAGIAALASGAVSGALELALHHARTRDLYGSPIGRLGAIREHLVRMLALDVVVAALAVKAAYVCNRFGPGAGYLGAAAKYAACRFAEEAVGEGRYVLGARALLEDLPYATFVRDVLLYGVFDGTSHVVLDDLSDKVLRFAVDARPRPTLDTLQDLYAAEPKPLVMVGRQPWRPYAPALVARCHELAEASGSGAVRALADMASALAVIALEAHAARRWGTDQALRFETAALLAELEALLATCELTFPECRRALDLPGDAMVTAAAARYAVDWIGGRIQHRLSELSRAIGSAVAERAVSQVSRPTEPIDAQEQLRAFVGGWEQ